MPFILGSNSVSGYTVKNSLRFNSGSSDYLNRTPASAGNRQIYTLSAWIKRGRLSVNTRQCLLSAGNNDGTDSGAILIGFTDSDAFTVETFQVKILTTQVFRDVSAWYHIVVAIDTTQTGITNQAKLYVNGLQVTQFSTTNAFSASVNTPFNNTLAHEIGRQTNATSRFFDGYLSEYYWIDGQALTPSSFGETDTDTGIWIPKAYTGTYGTNGFYLKFANSASLGTDSSGNGNTFTVNNLTSVDQSTDTPTNNFCTLNPLNTQSSVTLSEGNLKQVCTATSNDIAGTTMGVSKGKWYWEIKVIDVDDIDGGTFIGTSAFQLRMDGALTNLTASGTAPSGFVDGDYMGIALDVDNLQVQFYKNGSTNGTACTITSTFDFILPRNGNNRNNFEFNFGSPPFTIASGNTDGAGFGNFEYAPPSGYYALCTKNLANYG